MQCAAMHDSYASLIFKITEGMFYHLPEGKVVSERVITWSLFQLFNQIFPNKSFFKKKALISFLYLLVPLNEQNKKNILRTDAEL